MQAVGLPYIDNAKAILITAAINLAAVFLFNWPNGVSYSGVIPDSLFCAVVTTAVNIRIVYSRLKEMRSQGTMPVQVPESVFMQKLPRNPVLLGLIYAVAFAVVAAGANALLWWFFGIRDMAFAPWLVYKLVYATWLSAKIIEWCVFRYVQPDWANRVGGSQAEKTLAGPPIRNPLPKISVFKEVYGSVTGNIALNLVAGSVLGGITIGSDAVIRIQPTTPDGIAITGLVLGLITGILVTNGVVGAMDAAILASCPTPAENARAAGYWAWLPKGKMTLICLVSICLMIASALILRSAMLFWDIPRLDFFQFIVFISVYAMILSKPLSFLLAKRCAQPDYIRRRLRKAAKAGSSHSQSIPT